MCRTPAVSAATEQEHMDVNTDTQTALATWMQARLDGADAVEVVDFAAPRSGYSAETTVFNANVTRAGVVSSERFVLRQETPDPAVYPVQAPGLDIEISVQYRAMEAVAANSTVPLAPLIGFEDDTTVIGTPFFVMGYVAGEVPIENPNYVQQGFFADATPEQRATMINDGLRVMAEVHRIDWRAAGLDWLVPPDTTPGTTRQIEVWESYGQRELDGRRHPLMEDAFAWLHANQPPEPPLGMSWGDPRPGNIIWNDFTAACVTDFEACSIAPAEHDLGWWLMFDRWSHESMGAERLPGEPTRDEQTAFYETCLGRSVGDTYWWEVFAATRYAAIVVRVMNRMVARGQMPADQTIWLDNPATVCLADLMGR